MLPGMPIDGAIIFLLVSVARAMAVDVADMDAVIEQFVALKDNVHSFYSDPNQASQLIERGEVAVAIQYSARIGQLMKRYDHIIRATPAEGVPAIPYDLVVAARTSRPEEAANYVNLALSAEVQADVCAAILLNPSVSGVALSEETLRYIITDQSRLFPVDDAAIVDHQQEWLERWQREVQS